MGLYDEVHERGLPFFGRQITIASLYNYMIVSKSHYGVYYVTDCDDTFFGEAFQYIVSDTISTGSFLIFKGANYLIYFRERCRREIIVF